MQNGLWQFEMLRMRRIDDNGILMVYDTAHMFHDVSAVYRNTRSSCHFSRQYHPIVTLNINNCMNFYCTREKRETSPYLFIVIIARQKNSGI